MILPIKEIDQSDYLQANCWIDEPILRHQKIGKTVFCRLNVIDEIQDDLNEPVILVTDNGDVTLSKAFGKYICHTSFQEYLSFEKIPQNIVKWFGTSLNVKEDVFTLLPLGVLPQHFECLIEVANRSKYLRNNLLYCNFGLTSQHRIELYEKFYGSREENFTSFAKTEWPPNVGWPKYRDFLLNFVENLATSKFVLCPSGVGIDTFRLWESMYMGCIPILIKSGFTEHLKNFPVLIVNDYKEINKSLLEQEFQEIWSKTYDLSVLTKSYYKNKIELALKSI